MASLSHTPVPNRVIMCYILYKCHTSHTRTPDNRRRGWFGFRTNFGPNCLETQIKFGQRWVRRRRSPEVESGQKLDGSERDPGTVVAGLLCIWRAQDLSISITLGYAYIN